MKIFIKENAFENVVSKNMAIQSQPQHADPFWPEPLKFLNG